MASHQVGQSAPYYAANGHKMVAPLYKSDRDGATPYKIYSWAWCVDSCPACHGGGSPDDYCGESWDGDY